MKLDGIKNFVVVNDDLATAGQPTADQMREVAEEGFEVVINLAVADSTPHLHGEAALVESLGLTYEHIPVVFKAPTGDDLARFFRVMEESRGKKVFVHCAANYRVSCFVSLYGQARLGWSLEQAQAHIRRLWEPDAVWSRFLETARREMERDT
jgi:uncharacterized protein (TIGR01244 family)